MIPAHLSDQIYPSIIEKGDCTLPKYGKLLEFLPCLKVLNMYGLCGYDTRQFHPFCT